MLNSLMAELTHIFINNVQIFPFLYMLCYFIFVSLVIGILTGVRLCLSVVLINVFRVVNDTEHFSGMY